MRLDKFLKVSRIIKRRTLSKEITDSDRVMVNNKMAKPSTQLKVGDEIEITFGNKVLVIKVLSLNEHTSKEASSLMYEVIREFRRESE